MSEESDCVLVQRCLDGDPQAFEEIVGRYEKSLFNLALRMTNNVEDALEITQTSFTKAFEKLPTFKPEYAFFSWIYRIGTNESLNFLKRKRHFEGLEENFVARDQSAEEKCHASEQTEIIQTALTELKPKYRVLIVLRHFQELSYEEIGTILELSPEKVKSRLLTARQLLREQFRKRGLAHG